jgi:hypothetical protein
MGIEGYLDGICQVAVHKLEAFLATTVAGMPL